MNPEDMNPEDMDPADYEPNRPNRPNRSNEPMQFKNSKMMPKPPKLPVNRPKYLLDTQSLSQEYEIRLFDEFWDGDGGELKKNGYGAISYAWGSWMDRTTYFVEGSDVQNKAYPAFNIGKDSKEQPLSWCFPIVRQDPKNSTSAEQFTVEAALAAVSKMGLRYVWWDWACIPQGERSRTGNIQYRIHDELLPIVDQEMNKMRYVYPNSKRGIIWAHNIKWADDSALKKAFLACTEYSSTTQLQEKTLANVEKVISALQAANAEEAWFKSHWCFQEGVLFSHPHREPDQQSGIFLDGDGKALPVPSPRGEADLWDLLVVASRISAIIVNILRYKAEAPAKNPYRSWKSPLGSPNFRSWCIDGANEISARLMVDKLAKTGLAFYTSQSPLSLLNARWNRQRGGHTRLADIRVNTLIGALEVNIEQYQEQARIMDAAKALDHQSEGMLAELFTIYQWRMLLFATPRRVPTVDMAGIWSSLVEVRDLQQTQPAFTSLEYFLSTFNLQDRFKPARPLYKDNPKSPDPPRLKPAPVELLGQFALPTLQYSHENKYLTMNKLPNFKLFDLTKYTTKDPLWTKCMFYDFENTSQNGVFMPIFKVVSFDQWAQVFTDKAVFVPLENLPKNTASRMPWEKKDRMRCVVLNYFGDKLLLKYPEKTPTKLAATFVGVVDIELTPGIELGNLELSDAITIY